MEAREGGEGEVGLGRLEREGGDVGVGAGSRSGSVSDSGMMRVGALTSLIGWSWRCCGHRGRRSNYPVSMAFGQSCGLWVWWA